MWTTVKSIFLTCVANPIPYRSSYIVGRQAEGDNVSGRPQQRGAVVCNYFTPLSVIVKPIARKVLRTTRCTIARGRHAESDRASGFITYKTEFVLFLAVRENSVLPMG